MITIEAINTPENEIYYNPKNVKVFLAGGITNCPNWQKETLEHLEDYKPNNLIVFNPRRKTFDVTDPAAAQKQIEWEYKYLNEMDIFSMYFAAGDSPQPICMYELGRHLERMKARFPQDWKSRIVVSVEDGYCRAEDVKIQMSLVTGEYPHSCATPANHAMFIYIAYRRALNDILGYNYKAVIRFLLNLSEEISLAQKIRLRYLKDGRSEEYYRDFLLICLDYKEIGQENELEDQLRALNDKYRRI